DRVLALEFSQDSRYLFSGHGSGRVIQWKVDYNRKNWSNTCNQQAVVRQKKFGFAVYALKFVGEDQRKLAITGGDDEDGFFSSKLAVTGRYNQLLVLNSLEDKTPLKFRYPLGGQQKYIQSLDTAEFRPDLLVSADNQGRISLWDLQKCLVNQPCQPVEQWLEGHKGEGVRSVALSADGCYLVSGGDDGRVMLWSLNSQGKLADPQKHGEEIHSNEQQQVNSVDLKINLQWGLIENQEKILIASGWDGDPQVQVKELYKKDLKYNDCNKP
ncbi:MAG: WD40 repeat domain-containing protein, partial [Prochloraceae cyanobacterium]